MSIGFRRVPALFAAGTLLATAMFTGGPAAADDDPPAADAPAAHTLKLTDGSVLRWFDDGTGTLTGKSGTTRPFPVPRPHGRTSLGTPLAPTADLLRRRVDASRLTPYTVGSAVGAAGSAVRPQTMNYGPVAIPSSVLSGADAFARATPQTATPRPSPSPGAVPANAGLTTSFQSYLNSGGVNAVGAFADTATYLNALPGAGQIVTNVSLGDLTDQSMADSGDEYVRAYGPTTIVKDGRRYLDYPSMPLIPTYTSDNDGHLDPSGAIEGQDPNLSEVLMDFSVMAPLPHDRQRPEATGSGATDLLGIAPGAQYRLVVPEEPSAHGIAVALRAAAGQRPRPTVITASLGFGTDMSLGFPSRWLEDDPEIRATLKDIVDSGVVVVVSANDGTRLALPVSIGPDGGSTPTERTSRAAEQTSIDDVAPTTTPSRVRDTGVIDAGGTTVDDTLTSPDVRTAVYPATRYNGVTSYSTGFGSRVDLAAPGDNLPTLIHTSDGTGLVLNGGTSASAPMIAAAAANVLAAASATHQKLTPAQVRDLLIATGRPVAQPPQGDQELHVGPQLDVTAAVEKVLARRFSIETSAVRLSVAHRQLLSSDSATSFVEATDPAHLDLNGPADFWGTPSGQNVVSPITFGLDLTGRHDGLTYRLRVGDRGVIASDGPSLRLLPREILAAAGMAQAAGSDRTVPVVFEALDRGKVVASRPERLTFTATDGTYTGPLAPELPGSAPLGSPVTVRYDLTGVRNLTEPALVLSSVGHWSPLALSEKFRVQWSTPLTALKGTVTIPASAFAPGGAGIYGVGVSQQGVIFGDFRAIRVGVGAGQRPEAPLLSTGGRGQAHAVGLTRSAPKLTISWDTRKVPGADGAAVEFLTPAPSLYGSLNTVTNQNGSGRDDNGVDHASTLLRALPSAKGTTVLDLTALGLPTGVQYPVRVLATRKGVPVGQASPTSFVEYRDGDLVTGALENFEVEGDTALIATDEFADAADGSTHVAKSATTPYSLKTGRLGDPIASESNGSRMQEVVGTDPGTGHTLIVRPSFGVSAPAQIELRDTRTGAKIAEAPLTDGVNAQWTLFQGGAIDHTRHRAALATYDVSSGLARVWPVDMATGGIGTPIPVNAASPGRSFSNLSVDESTGTFFVATSGTLGACLSGRVPYWAVRVDLDAGTASPLTTIPACAAGLLPDGKGGKVYLLSGAATPDYSSGRFPTSSWLAADQSTLTGPSPADLGTRGPAWAALDEVNHVAVVAHLYEVNTTDDNNAQSEITVIDPATGEVLARHPVINLGNSTLAMSNFDFTSRRGLFLDPATRTGYVVNPYGNGLERFHY
ncbi:S8 family serine peptidase [Microbispora sp. RL4-1S]|uniref:S8 family serine peptidase n=1 Tax=Microbispora oryzae TaxID=2806554 RepID=A0A941ARZ9_9ACTN|nr:S8 family serine peptidase [Microbispora oryzae]MBP2706979.1 S8 family serine peptidase [Microbispora oryzae]